MSETKAEKLYKQLVEITDLFKKAINYDDIDYIPENEDGDKEEIYFWYLIPDSMTGMWCLNYLETADGQECNIAFHEHADKVYIGFTWYGTSPTNVDGFKELADFVIVN